MNRSQMRKIMKEVAKSNCVSVGEVKREMQAAIDIAYKNPTQEGLGIPRKGKIPMPQEFIDHVAENIIKSNNNENN